MTAATVNPFAMDLAVANSRPQVIGMDLSLTASGVMSSAGWTRTIGVKGLTTLPLPARIVALDGLVGNILHTVTGEPSRPELVVIEAPVMRGHAATGGVVERSALWWLVNRALLAAGVSVLQVATTQRAMYATGKGNAAKTAVVEAATRRWPAYRTGGDDNLCDALVLMAIGRDVLGFPLCDMPATHRRALDKLAPVMRR